MGVRLSLENAHHCRDGPRAEGVPASTPVRHTMESVSAEVDSIGSASRRRRILRRCQASSMKSAIRSCTASTMCSPFAVWQPRA